MALPPRMRLEAERLAIAIESSRVGPQDAAEWACRWINDMRKEALPDQLLDLSTSGAAHPLDVANLLHRLAEQHDPRVLHALKREAARARIVSIAQGVLRGKTRSAEAAREMVGLRFDEVGDARDTDFDIFVALDSSTDHLPVGVERAVLWSPAVLPNLDIELRDIENFYRESVLEACRNLVARFGVSDEPKLDDLEARRRWFEHHYDLLESTSILIESKPGVTFRCPCCGSKTLDMRGGFEICPVCFWEDDGQDDHDADVVRGGPNGKLSLTLARANYREFAACQRSALEHVRPPHPDEM
jgi:hypothetical protein